MPYTTKPSSRCTRRRSLVTLRPSIGDWRSDPAGGVVQSSGRVSTGGIISLSSSVALLRRIPARSPSELSKELWVLALAPHRSKNGYSAIDGMYKRVVTAKTTAAEWMEEGILMRGDASKASLAKHAAMSKLLVDGIKHVLPFPCNVPQHSIDNGG